MIVADTSVWIDHIRRPEDMMLRLLGTEQVLMHRFVVAEIALGSIADRAALLHQLTRLVQAEVATHEEVMTLIERRVLHGIGIGYVDAHLLTSILIMPGAQLWTRDRRLRLAAERLGVAAREG